MIARGGLLLLGLGACAAAPVAPPSLAMPPPVVTSVAPARQACEVPALRGADSVHVHIEESGHWGIFEMHFDLIPIAWVGRSGVASVTYRRSPDGPIASEAHAVKLEPAVTDELVSAFETASTVVDHPNPRRITIDDSSRTRAIVIDIGRGNEHALFETDEAQSQPATWRMRGCAQPFVHDAMPALEKAIGAFLAKLDFGPLLEAARKHTP